MFLILLISCLLLAYVPSAEAQYNIQLNSRSDDGAWTDKGTIYIQGDGTKNFGSTIYKQSGSYEVTTGCSIKYNDARYSFDRWETSGSVSVSSTYKSSSVMNVGGSGALTAVFLKEDFTLDVSTSSQEITVGDTAYYSFTITRTALPHDGCSLDISLELSGNPSGSTFNIGPNPVYFSSTLSKTSETGTFYIVTTSNTLPGTYTITFKSTITGGYSTSYSKSVMLKVNPPYEKKPDLIIQDFYWTPSNPYPGDKVTFTYVEKNQGDGDATGHRVTLYIDDQVISSDDITETLPAGSSRTRTFSDKWAAISGGHDAFVKADSTGGITESNDENNGLHKTIGTKENLLTPSPTPTLTPTTTIPQFQIMSIDWKGQAKPVTVFGTENIDSGFVDIRNSNYPNPFKIEVQIQDPVGNVYSFASGNYNNCCGSGSGDVRFSFDVAAKLGKQWFNEIYAGVWKMRVLIKDTSGSVLFDSGFFDKVFNPNGILTSPTPAIDNPPSISVTYPANGTTVTTSSITISGVASDDIGLVKVDVSVNGGTYYLASGTTSWSINVNLNTGSNTIRVRAVDTKNQMSSVSVIIYYREITTVSPTPVAATPTPTITPIPTHLATTTITPPVIGIPNITLPPIQIPETILKTTKERKGFLTTAPDGTTVYLTTNYDSPNIRKYYEALNEKLDLSGMDPRESILSFYFSLMIKTAQITYYHWVSVEDLKTRDLPVATVEFKKYYSWSAWENRPISRETLSTVKPANYDICHNYGDFCRVDEFVIDESVGTVPALVNINPKHLK